MKKILLVFGMFVLLSSCAENTKQPKGILSKEEMVAFLVDVHLAEAKVSNMSLPNDSAHGLFQVYERVLYKKYNTTDSLYKKSLDYYLSNIKKMDEIYSAVVDTLNVRDKKLKDQHGIGSPGRG